MTDHYNGVYAESAEGFAKHTDRAVLSVMVQTLDNMKTHGIDVSSADKAVQVLQRAGYCPSELKLFLRYTARALRRWDDGPRANQAVGGPCGGMPDAGGIGPRP